MWYHTEAWVYIFKCLDIIPVYTVLWVSLPCHPFTSYSPSLASFPPSWQELLFDPFSDLMVVSNVLIFPVNLWQLPFLLSFFEFECHTTVFELISVMLRAALWPGVTYPRESLQGNLDWQEYCCMFWGIWSALLLLSAPWLLIFFLNVVSMLKWPERNVYFLFSVSSWMLFNVWFYVVIMSSRLNFRFIYFSDISILLACISVSHVCGLCLWHSEENINFSGTGVTCDL